jgi:predicted acetyltransferase
MDHEVRPLTADDVEATVAIRAQAFNNPVSDAQREVVADRIGRGGSIGVDVGGELAGLLVVYPLGQFFGGRSVPMGGVASVAVSVEHRSKGVASALVRGAIERMRADGLALSTLHPATATFYRRAGYELAGAYPIEEVPARALGALARGEAERLRAAGPADLPALRECYARAAPERAGWVDRPDWFWDRAYDPGRDGWHVLACESRSGGGLDGFVLYARSSAESSFGWALEVAHLVAVDAVAELTLWRGIASFASQVETVTVAGGSGDRLPFLLPEQDVRTREANAWMTRLVDASGAVAARGFPIGVTVETHVELRDDLAPWNAGRWVLRVADGKGALEPGGDGRLELGERAFAALFTGYASAFDLAGAGLLRGERADLAALDAAFAGPRPSMLEYF